MLRLPDCWTGSLTILLPSAAFRGRVCPQSLVSCQETSQAGNPELAQCPPALPLLPGLTSSGTGWGWGGVVVLTLHISVVIFQGN